MLHMFVELLLLIIAIITGLLTFRYRHQIRLMLRPRTGVITCYVSANASLGGDGSEANPFRTILEALEEGQTTNVAAISVIILEGTYSNDLNITRATTLTGRNHPNLKCSIRNLSGYDLTIKSLTISEAQGRAIFQSGGRLIIEDVYIGRTKIVDGDPESGRAIEMVCNDRTAFASFKNVGLSYNEGHALLLSGDFTKAVVLNVQVEHNSVDPTAFESSQETEQIQLIGAVEVANGAKLMMENFTISENACCGVLVRDGGRAHLRNGTVNGTKKYQNRFGTNLEVLNGGKLELNNFISSNAEYCGLELKNAYLKMLEGTIRDNLIGIAFLSIPLNGINSSCTHSGLRKECLGGDSVQYINNQTVIGSGLLLLPDLMAESCGPCPTLVSWE